MSQPKISSSQLSLDSFRASMSAGVSVPTGVETVLPFDRITGTWFGVDMFDTTGLYNSGTYTFTPSISGVYVFSVRAKWVSSPSLGSKYRWQLLLKNGSTYLASNSIYYQPSFLEDFSMMINTTVSLSAGSVITAYAYQDSGSSVTIGTAQPTFNEFSGYKLG